METELAAGELTVYNPNTSAYEDSADWHFYLATIEKKTALVNISFPKPDGSLAFRSHRVMVDNTGGRPHPSRKRLALRDALQATLDYDELSPDLSACADANATALCRDSFGYIQANATERTSHGYHWLQRLHLGVLPISADGEVIRTSDGEIDQKLVQRSLDQLKDGDSVLDLPLVAGWEYHMVLPNRPNAEISTVTFEPSHPEKAGIEAVVRDQLGVAKVELCGLSNGGCRELRRESDDRFVLEVALDEVGPATRIVATNTRKDESGAAYMTSQLVERLQQVRKGWLLWQSRRPGAESEWVRVQDELRQVELRLQQQDVVPQRGARLPPRDFHCIENGSRVAISTGIGWFASAQGTGELHANSQRITDREAFILTNHTDKLGCLKRGDVISLYSVANSSYVSLTANGHALAGAGVLGVAEQFTVR